MAKLNQTNPKFEQVRALAKEHGLKIQQVSRKLGVYAGMNPEAARLIGFKGCPKKTLFTDKNQSERRQGQTGKHEILEYFKIRAQTPEQKKLPKYKRYLLGHRYAENHENDTLTQVCKELGRIIK